MDKALIVGINRYPNAELRGCLNDVSDYANFLVNKCKFSMSSIHILTDEQATTKNILSRLDWLVNGGRKEKNNRLFFAFSGHGVQVATRDSQKELDGLDEVICPINFNWTQDTMISDWQLNEIFSRIGDNSNLLWISDSCHSGDLNREITPRYTSPKLYPMTLDMHWRINTIKKERPDINNRCKTIKEIATNKPNILLISGCLDNETSADACFEGRYNGALTYYLLKHFNNINMGNITIQSLIADVVTSLHEHGYSQTPSLYGNIEKADNYLQWFK